MSTALLISGKDLRQRVRDRSAFVLAIVLPLALAFVFNLVFGSAATPRPFRYAVTDEDQGHISRAFTTEMLGQLVAQEILTVRVVETREEAADLAESGVVDAAFVLPAGFTAAVLAGGDTTITVIGNADSPTGSDVARSLADSFLTSLNAVRLSVAATIAGRVATPDEIAEFGSQAAAAAPALALRNTSTENRILDAKTYFAAAMAVFFLFFTVQFGVSSLIDENSFRTLDRLLAAPINRRSILGGKLITSFVLGAVSMTVLVVATTLLMGARWGPPAGVAALVAAGVLAATGVTGVVASFAKTPDQAGSWQALVSVLLGLLGGAFFPVSQIGGVAAALSLATPHAWFLRGLGDLSGSGNVTDALPAVGALLAFTALTGGVALFRLDRAVQR
jgi:ABC-2 type transport system permease protein